MKTWTSVLAILMAISMVASAAYAQTGSGASGAASGAGSGAGSSATGATSGGGAVGTPGSSTGGADKSKSESPSGTPSSGSSATSGSSMPSGATTSSSSMSSGEYTGRHTMEGEVTKVDPKKGHLTLKTAEGNMDLHFPPTALSSVKKGDHISVELAMKPVSQASMSNDHKAKGSASPKTDKGSTKY